jgi:hypothetical protein
MELFNRYLVMMIVISDLFNVDCHTYVDNCVFLSQNSPFIVSFSSQPFDFAFLIFKLINQKACATNMPPITRLL